VTVASPRLDTLVAEGFGLPRADAAALVAQGAVSLNYEPCAKPDRRVEEGDLLSVRGKGRLRLLSIGGASRKGRLFVTLGIPK